MSMRKLCEIASEFQSLNQQIGSLTQKSLQENISKVLDLTNNEVWWMRAQAVVTGVGAGLSGTCSVLGTTIADDMQIGFMSAETIRSTIKALGAGSNALSEIGSSVSRSQTTIYQTKKSLTERCEISKLQQDISARDSTNSQMMQAVQGIMSAKARLG